MIVMVTLEHQVTIGCQSNTICSSLFVNVHVYHLLGFSATYHNNVCNYEYILSCEVLLCPSAVIYDTTQYHRHDKSHFNLTLLHPSARTSAKSSLHNSTRDPVHDMRIITLVLCAIQITLLLFENGLMILFQVLTMYLSTFLKFFES